MRYLFKLLYAVILLNLFYFISPSFSLVVEKMTSGAVSSGLPVIDNFSASPTSVKENESISLSWETTNTSECSIDNDIGPVPLNGSAEVIPKQMTTTYTLVCKGMGVNISKIVVVYIKPYLKKFSIDREIIDKGGTAILKWESAYTNRCYIDNNIGNIGIMGQIQLSPKHITYYTLVCEGDGGNIKKEVSIIVKPTIEMLSASPPVVKRGEDAVISWIAEDVTTCRFNNNIGDVKTKGKMSVSLNTHSRYLLSCEGKGGTIEKELFVGIKPEIISFTVSQQTVEEGKNIDLMWETMFVDECFLSNIPDPVPETGIYTMTPLNMKTVVTLSCRGKGGSIEKDIVVFIKPKIEYFGIDKKIIKPNETVLLKWKSKYTTICVIDSNIGRVDTIGKETRRISKRSVFRLSCKGEGGDIEREVIVSVTPTIDVFDATPNVISPNGSSVLTWRTSNAVDCSLSNIGTPIKVKANDSYRVSPKDMVSRYLLTCSNESGHDGKEIYVYIKPIIEYLKAEPSVVKINERASISWETSYTTECYINNGIGKVPVNGNVTVMPDKDTSYTLECSGYGEKEFAKTFIKLKRE